MEPLRLAALGGISQLSKCGSSWALSRSGSNGEASSKRPDDADARTLKQAVTPQSDLHEQHANTILL